MPLIDEIGKTNSKENNNHKCNTCKIDLPPTLDVDVCENCFNNKVDEALKNIQNIIVKIKLEIEKVVSYIENLHKELAKENLHILAVNKINIDLLNLESVHKKLLIDLDTNYKGFDLNQSQANEFRKRNGWKIKEIISLNK